MSEHFGFRVDFFFLRESRLEALKIWFGRVQFSSSWIPDFQTQTHKRGLVFSREKTVQIRYSVLRTKEKNIGNFESLELGPRTCIISVYGDS